MKRLKKCAAIFLALVMLLGILTGCGSPQAASAPAGQTASQSAETKAPAIDKNGAYTSKEDVALYIHTYGRLPENYISKAQAKQLGWQTKGSLDQVAPGKSIGGDRFGNYEGVLPEVKGRTYHECDIDYSGGSRNAKRIVYSDDGNIYYTEDHYKTFEHLYGDDN
jgi:ribonuclease T1